MKGQLLLVLALGLVLGADDAKQEKEKLQGTWKAVTVEERGQSKQDNGEHQLICAGDEFRIQKGDQTIIKGTFKLDPSQKPKAIDMEITEDRQQKNVGKTALGIYLLSGHELKWCAAEPGTSERPKEFSAPADTRHVLVTFKREPK